MPRVIHFEIPADDVGRAVEFYRKAFGWRIEKWGEEEYWLATTGEKGEPGIDGAISPRAQNPTTTNTISVPSIKEFAERVVAAGGKVVSPITPITGFGWFAACVDTEGNAFGIMQEDPQAHV